MLTWARDFPRGCAVCRWLSSRESRGSRVNDLSASAVEPAEAQIQRMFTAGGAEWLHLRHAEAGCFIASIDPCLNPGHERAAFDAPEELNMFKARVGYLLAGALSLCVLAHAGEPSLPPRQIAPPKRIPDVDPGIALEITQPTGEPVSTANMPRAVRLAVVADAAKRFQVAEDAVVLASAEQVTWGDGSLGCPQPGRSYTQMLVAGYRVTATTAAGRSCSITPIPAAMS